MEDKLFDKKVLEETPVENSILKNHAKITFNFKEIDSNNFFFCEINSLLFRKNSLFYFNSVPRDLNKRRIDN